MRGSSGWPPFLAMPRTPMLASACDCVSATSFSWSASIAFLRYILYSSFRSWYRLSKSTLR